MGALVVAIAIVSAAAIARGSAGYLYSVIPIQIPILVTAVIICMGAAAAWGILQSATLIGLMTLIELGGLLAIVMAGAANWTDMTPTETANAPDLSQIITWGGVLSATMLAFFAFVGFEGLVNIAEEVKEPSKTLPRAIALTLIISTVLYVLVSLIALRAVSRGELAVANAPLSLVFERVTGVSPFVISVVAIIATANGIIVQIVMAARVLYGLAKQGLVPRFFANVNARTQTPLIATVVSTASIMLLALAFPLEGLAEATSRLTLIVFALVNAALIRLNRRPTLAAAPFTVPALVPKLGLILCTTLLLGSALL